MTIGELKEKIAEYSDDVELHFEGMEFYRFKWRNSDMTLLQMEFNDASKEGMQDPIGY